MARVHTYLNFNGDTEAAFAFYRGVFGTEYDSPIMRMGDLPPAPDQPELSDADKQMVMHVSLPTIGDHLLMGTDVPSFMPPCVIGSNVLIMLDLDSRQDVDRFHGALSDGGDAGTPPQDMFWGAYWGSCVDRFGVRWMFNHATAPAA